MMVGVGLLVAANAAKCGETGKLMDLNDVSE